MNDKTFLSKINGLNFILALLIVALHASGQSYLLKGSNYQIFNSIFQFIGIIADLATPTFFFISSYLFYRNFTYSKYKSKMCSRIKSLVIPFFIWSTIFLFIFFIIQNLPLNININQEKIRFDLKFIFNAIFFNEYNTPIWFLRTLFIYALISPILFWLLKSLKKYSFVISIIFVILNLLSNIKYTSIFFWMPIYFLGAYSAQYLGNVFDERFIKIYKKYYYFVLLFLLSVIVLLIKSFFRSTDKSDNLYYIYRMISPIIVIGFALITNKNIYVDNKKKMIIFSSSFFIFCSHSIVILFVRKLLLIFLGANNRDVFIAYILTVFISVISIELIYLFLNKFFPKVLNVLLGCRKKEIL